MSIDNLELLISRLEEAIATDLLNDDVVTKDSNLTNKCNLFNELKQEPDRLRQENARYQMSRASWQNNQHLLRTFVRHLPSAVAILDREMQYIAVSERWIKDYNLDDTEIIGRTHYEVFPETPQRWREDHRNCLAGKVKFSSSEEDFFVRHDGRINRLRWQLRPWHDSQGQIGGLLMFSQIIAQNQLLQQKNQSAEDRMRAIFTGMNELVFTVELDTDSITILPTKFFELYNDAVVESIITQTQTRLFCSAEAEDFQASIRQVLKTQRAVDFEYSLKLDDSTVWFSVKISFISETEIIWIARDITNRKESEQDLLFVKQELAQVTLHSIGDAVITTDADGRVEYINPVAEKLTGWQAQEALSQFLTHVFQLVDESTRKAIANPIQRVSQEHRVYNLAARELLLARNGKEYAIEGLASPIKSRDKLIGTVIVFRDVTSARKMARKISWQAAHDSLTKLCNRQKFEEYVAKAIEDTRHKSSNNALCLLDLDRFKIVNDTCGHAAGDRLLQQVTELLKKRIRSSDIFARVGGDEFGLLFRHCPINIAQTIAEQLRQLIENFRFVWEDKVFRIGVSIGLVEIEPTTEDLAGLLSTADAACYAAKQRGGNYVYLYREANTIVARQREERQWIEKLNRALEENSFRLYIQKIVPVTKRYSLLVKSDRFLDAQTCGSNLCLAPNVERHYSCHRPAKQDFACEASCGSHRFLPQLSEPETEKSFAGCHYEVLLRSVDPAGNLIAPGVFLPAAERYGLMPAIDRWVITTFLSSYEVYCQSKSERHLEPVPNLYGINLSGASINSEFAHFLQEQFDRYRIPPATICFEITETVAISNLDSAIALIEQLKELGCSIALDNFGSGMSSLTYLKNLPIDYLKIDGSLIANLANDEIDYATVECFNYISQMMNIKTVAEFVENQAILGKLEQIGLDYAQGYAIERPHPLVWN